MAGCRIMVCFILLVLEMIFRFDAKFDGSSENLSVKRNRIEIFY
jgi:hypothetical protein